MWFRDYLSKHVVEHVFFRAVEKTDLRKISLFFGI